ncbi:hypothetical protein [Kineococcus radiotolerans]|uniref:hypothetical protein n=1 Tax=Kineococcus radiotolerans TaxID=131568 RepID=UPI0012FF1698|nr:hypothetical protein [Kineococcus radiotolerans]
MAVIGVVLVLLGLAGRPGSWTSPAPSSTETTRTESQPQAATAPTREAEGL